MSPASLSREGCMDPTGWNLPFPAVVAALFVIVMLRANGTYWLGRLGSAGARRTRLGRLLDSPGYARATERIDRFGPPVVALSFLTIGFQTVANLAAGVSGCSTAPSCHTAQVPAANST